MDELELLKQEVEELKRVVYLLVHSDRYLFTRDVQFRDGRNIQLATGTGTKIGTATGQKLGFFNATPVDQPATVTDASGCAGNADDKVNDIIDRLQELGLIA